MMDREVDVAAMTMDTTIITTITEVDALLTRTISLATLLAPTMTTTQQVEAILLYLRLQASRTLQRNNALLPTPSIL